MHKEIPLLGINLGNLGFLAEVNQTSLYSALDQLMADDYGGEEHDAGRKGVPRQKTDRTGYCIE